MVHHKEYGLFSVMRRVWDLLKETYSEWRRDNATELGAALAFYTIFSLAPILIIAIVVVGHILGEQSVQLYILKELTKLIGKENASNIMDIILNFYKARSARNATSIAILLILVGSTTIFAMLKKSLNNIWGIIDKGFIEFIKERLISFMLVLFVGVVLFLSMITSSLMVALNNFMNTLFAFPIIFYQSIDCVFSIILLTFIFAVLYKILPDVNILWSDVWVGSAITALLFTVGKFVFGLYIAKSTLSSAYGAAGSLVAILLWVYYNAQILFIGAEFTKVYARKYGSQIAPEQAR